MAERKIRIDLRLVMISFLMMMDYILTFVGINVNFITEGNPLMKWVFELNFFQGCLVRFVIIFIVISLAHILKRDNKKFYKNFTLFAIGTNMFVLGLHFRWIMHFFMTYAYAYS